MVFVSVYSALKIKPAEFPVAVRYADDIDRERWVGQLAFPLFLVTSGLAHVFLSMRFHALKPQLSKMILLLGLVFGLLGLRVMVSILAL